MREFNITGTCIPHMHYMVDIQPKIKKIIELIDKGKYFTINRSRQFGKTTTLLSLENTLKDHMEVISISFEGVGDAPFTSNMSFVDILIPHMAKAMKFTNIEPADIDIWQKKGSYNEKNAIVFLNDKITSLCEKYEVVLMIDEMDKFSDNQVFLNFLGMLREKYLARNAGKDYTFKSVIMAGVYDVKNLKLRLRPDEERKYNSPWNIAADFNVDMSFSPAEISTMLEDYEKDHSTGMDVDAISNEIYLYTSGYPFLVSRICKTIDENESYSWDSEGIENAIKDFIKSKNTLLDDLAKNCDNNPKLDKMISDILLSQKEILFNHMDATVDLGCVLGIFKDEKGKVKISNLIFETCLYDRAIAKYNEENYIILREENRFVKDGRLDMVLILTKFRELMESEYRREDEKFIEQQGRLLFLCFLKPIINGAGFYYVEPQTRNNNRMDMVVTYGGEEHIIELKIWRGEAYRKEGIMQLCDYLDSRHQDTGYLVSFSFNKNKEYQNHWIDDDTCNKNIYEVVV